MRCPECRGLTEVMQTRARGDVICRRRRCQLCKERFTTYEKIASRLGRRMPRNGATRAALPVYPPPSQPPAVSRRQA